MLRQSSERQPENHYQHSSKFINFIFPINLARSLRSTPQGTSLIALVWKLNSVPGWKKFSMYPYVVHNKLGNLSCVNTYRQARTQSWKAYQWDLKDTKVTVSKVWKWIKFYFCWQNEAFYLYVSYWSLALAELKENFLKIDVQQLQ